MRPLCFGVLIGLLLALSVRAPVPKSPPPPKLTAERMVGSHHYEWGSWLDGVIHLNADGSYTAIHVPGSSSVYFGRWTVADGHTVVLTEYRHCLNTNGVSGPSEFRFQFDPKDFPALTGKSNGTTHVVIAPLK